MITQRFVVEFTTKEAPTDPIAAADELLEALGDGVLPAWVWSVDGADPEDELPPTPVATPAARRGAHL